MRTDNHVLRINEIEECDERLRWVDLPAIHHDRLR